MPFIPDTYSDIHHINIAHNQKILLPFRFGEYSPWMYVCVCVIAMQHVCISLHPYFFAYLSVGLCVRFTHCFWSFLLTLERILSIDSPTHTPNTCHCRLVISPSKVSFIPLFLFINSFTLFIVSFLCRQSEQFPLFFAPFLIFFTLSLSRPFVDDKPWCRAHQIELHSHIDTMSAISWSDTHTHIHNISHRI